MIIEVQTTQNVTIDYETASIGYRILAYIIDWVIIIIWFLGWLGMSAVTDLNISGIFWIIVVFAPILFYDLIMETSGFALTFNITL